MSLSQLLETAYRPVGVRLGILVSSDCDPEDVAAAARVLRSHGHDPARRLARLHPRVGERDPRPADIADFLRRYGHEYCVAWLPAPDTEGARLISAAARESGCALGWAPPRSA